MVTYKMVDLFAGIGGIRKGFEMTGRFANVMSRGGQICMPYL